MLHGELVLDQRQAGYLSPSDHAINPADYVFGRSNGAMARFCRALFEGRWLNGRVYLTTHSVEFQMTRWSRLGARFSDLINWRMPIADIVDVSCRDGLFGVIVVLTDRHGAQRSFRCIRSEAFVTSLNTARRRAGRR